VVHRGGSLGTDVGQRCRGLAARGRVRGPQGLAKDVHRGGRVLATDVGQGEGGGSGRLGLLVIKQRQQHGRRHLVAGGGRTDQRRLHRLPRFAVALIAQLHRQRGQGRPGVGAVGVQGTGRV